MERFEYLLPSESALGLQEVVLVWQRAGYLQSLEAMALRGIANCEDLAVRVIECSVKQPI